MISQLIASHLIGSEVRLIPPCIKDSYTDCADVLCIHTAVWLWLRVMGASFIKAPDMAVLGNSHSH